MKGVVLFVLLLLLCVLCCCYGEEQNEQQYLATVHHAPEGYIRSNKRGISSGQFVGNLIFNNTLNENGEVTVSLCDITRDLFGDGTKYKLFDLDKTGGIDSVVNAHLKAAVALNVNIDGCLQFFFDPCCETVGLRFVLDNPVVLDADASVSVDLSALGIGFSGKSGNINLDPLGDIKLGGFSPVVGSWKLPSILDNFVSTTMSNDRLCANLGLPGGLPGLKFCVELQNFTASFYKVNVCPRVTVYLGPQKLLDLSYTQLVPQKAGGVPQAPPACLALSFIPMCSHAGSSVTPDIMQLFKSIDVNNDFKIVIDEIIKSKALLGVYNTKDTNSLAFEQMDGDADGEVHFQEFQTYTRTQSQNFETSPYSTTPTYSPGDIALAIIMTMLATAVVVGIAIVVFAQYKGIVNIGPLSKIMPSPKKRGGDTHGGVDRKSLVDYFRHDG